MLTAHGHDGGASGSGPRAESEDAAETAERAPAPAFLGVESSLSGKRWTQRAADEAAVKAMMRAHGLAEPLAAVLAARGVAPEDAPAALEPTLKALTPDPSSLADMDAAAAAVWDALEAGRTVGLFADYDTDGASSAAQLSFWLEAAGQAHTPVYIPHRLRDGYGPSLEGFEALRAEGAELVITLDCGAAAHGPLEAARELGLDVVVIDHHLMADNPPPALAVVNPRRADDTSGLTYLAAAGVTFLLLVALNREGRARGRFGAQTAPNLLDFLDLAALGTVADVVPLTGFNRALVRQGLRRMSADLRPGLAALAERAGRTAPFEADDIGFAFGPRLNAAGRLAEGLLAWKLLTARDEAGAQGLALRLDELNAERRGIEKRIVAAAAEQIEAQLADNPDLPIGIAAGEDWHPGVAGVAAGRLAERFARPVLVIGFDEDGLGRGSGRSVPGVDLGGAVALARAAGLLVAGGGHPMACGLTLKKQFLKPFKAFIAERLAEQPAPRPPLELDGRVALAGVDRALVEQLAGAAPFGEGWPKPSFVIEQARIVRADIVGSDHVRVLAEDSSGGKIKGVCFRAAETPLGAALLARETLHLAVRLKPDDWNGRNGVDAEILDAARPDQSK